MPTYQGQLTEDQVIALIAYIKAIGARPIQAVAAGSSQQTAAGPGNSAAEPVPAETNKPGGR
jgi:hypothetical protein